MVFKRRGDLWFGLEEWDETLKDYERCRYLRARLAATMPENTSVLLELANIRLASGEVLWKQGKLTEAAATFDEVQQQLATPLLTVDNPEAARMRADTACAIQDLAQADAAKPHSTSPANGSDLPPRSR